MPRLSTADLAVVLLEVAAGSGASAARLPAAPVAAVALARVDELSPNGMA
jgi:hypothetical protein